MDDQRIATGDEAVAIRLGEFVRYYQPRGWVVPIHDVDFIPFFKETDIPVLRMGFVPSDASWGDKWYIKEAVSEFFKKEVGK